MFSSWPDSALVAGVKIGSGKRALSVRPAGKRMPQTVPLVRYSAQPDPGQIAADHALDGHDLGLAAKHRAAVQGGKIDAGWKVHLVNVGRDHVIWLIKQLEPESRDLG